MGMKGGEGSEGLPGRTGPPGKEVSLCVFYRCERFISGGGRSVRQLAFIHA